MLSCHETKNWLSVATADAVQVDAFAEEEAVEIARGARGDVAAMEG